jgi:hypothetical protein
VIGGKTISITAAPWSVVVREDGQFVCTGVIIDARHVLTAGHCVMYDDSATPEPASEFTIEAGVSNFNHPLASDHPQTRTVGAERVLPGFIATNRRTYSNELDAIGHDLAVLTLSRPLDLNGDDARAADLPSASLRAPSGATRVMQAGFGNENPKPGAAYANGDLNEVAKSTVWTVCSTRRTICVYSTSGPCWGDSGSGLIEPGQRPTVVGILGTSQPDCNPGLGGYVSLTAPAILRFIKSSE